MSDPTASIDEALDEVRTAWRVALGTGGVQAVDGGDVQADVDAMSDPGLVAVNEALAVVRRRLDGLHARVAAGIVSRSAAERGSEGLARKQGHRSPVKLIAAATGGHAGDAARLIQVGVATTGRMTFSGERTPPKRPHIAAAFAAGALSVAGAAAINALLESLTLRVDATVLDEAEQTLVAQAALLTLDDLGAVLRRAEAFLDPDGVEPKIDELRSKRSLHIFENAAGMIVVNGVFDPESGAPIKTVLEALVTQQLRTSRGFNQPGTGDDAHATRDADDHAGCGAKGDHDCEHDRGCRDDCEHDREHDHEGGHGHERPGPVFAETRSVPQMQADALTAICRHVLGCDHTDLPLATTTIVVRIPLEALETGTGVATIDGIAQPIDAGTARRMAGNAEIIPCVLGGDSEILDWGRTRRLFTRSQRLAFVERDGGCAGCGLPPGMTEAHHLIFWSRGGTTDLKEGILLCTNCHHRVHNDNWEIRIDPPPGGDPTGGTVWFIPPTHIDPSRTPRLGGRKRYDYTHKGNYRPAA